MKSLTSTFCIIFAFMFILSTNSYAVRPAISVEQQHLESLTGNAYGAVSIESFLELTPKKIKKEMGQKLSIKEAIVLKAAQKKIKKAIKADQKQGGDKDQLVALILALFLGVLGIHRFYLGYVGIGIIQILTLGGCGIWALVDLILIITGNLRPKNGMYDPEL